MMHSHTVMDKGETSVCTVCKAEQSWCGVSACKKKREKIYTGKIIMMHSHTVMDKGEASVFTSSKQSRGGEIVIV